MDFATVMNRIVQRPSLDFGDIFGRSFELFKKVWLQGFITILLCFLVIIPLYLLIMLPMLAQGITDPEMLREEQLTPLTTLFLCITFPIGILVMACISLALMAGFYRICWQQDTGIGGKDDYFYYFKRAYWGRLMIVSLLTIIIAFLGALLCGIGAFYVMVPLYVLVPFVAFAEGLTPMEMVKASFRLGNKNWLVMFGLIIVSAFLSQLGFILCGVGVLFTSIFSKIPAYYMYKDGVGFEDEVLVEG